MLHNHNIIHRDLKPENIYIMEDTGDILIGDFGLSTKRKMGGTKSTLGTPEFMAPEQFDPTKSYDYRVDIYAIGLVALSLIVAEDPYTECEGNIAYIFKAIHEEKRPPK